ncbi:MAG TPA: hypothetical protein VFS43_46950 [Polyangiaceae bacterium]|nr:hypothetical protein [Polyangiaceae bacterium]
MSVVLGVACEDNGHFSAVTCLVDDVLVTSHTWLDGIVDACRTWRGVNEGEAWYKYDPGDATDLRPITVAGQRIKIHGPIRGEPLKPEASMWRRVLFSFCHTEPRPEVVILARDLDGYPKRAEGIKQVREGIRWPFRIVVAAAQPEIEAWRACGFTPADERERERLEALRRELSFDPTTQSHRLTSHPNDAPTDAKRVLTRLCDGAPERVDACLKDLAALRTRGRLNGAADFLGEIDEHIVPLFSSPR